MPFFKPADKQLINISCLLLLIITVSAQAAAVRTDSIGGRSELSITEFITSKLPDFMRIYSARLLERPGVGGKINFNFAIDEFGSVLFCNIINSAIGDDTLEDRLADFIMSWKFEKIDKPGDVAVVTYPFDFSQESKRGGGALAVGTDTAAGRSKESIFRAIKTKSSEFGKEYRARLADKPGLKGKIYFKFAINEHGNVIYSKVDRSTVNDTTLENRLAELIKGWKFEKSDTPGDILAVTYPFAFSSGGRSGIGVLLIASAVIVSLCSLFLLLIE